MEDIDIAEVKSVFNDYAVHKKYDTNIGDAVVSLSCTNVIC